MLISALNGSCDPAHSETKAGMNGTLYRRAKCLLTPPPECYADRCI